LHHVANRPAQIEDKLVTTKFNNSITRGFAAVGEPHVAVCLLPGTEITFDENVECEPSFGLGILPNFRRACLILIFSIKNEWSPTSLHPRMRKETNIRSDAKCRWPKTPPN
jgi:hypothetical protein